MDCHRKGQVVGTVGRKLVAIHSSGQTISSLAHIEGITLGAGTAVPVEISRYSFRAFSCAYPTVISSISGKSFHFPFPYFVIT